MMNIKILSSIMLKEEQFEFSTAKDIAETLLKYMKVDMQYY